MKEESFINLGKVIYELIFKDHRGETPDHDKMFRQQVYNIHHIVVKHPSGYKEIETLDELVDLINKTDLSFLEQLQRMIHRLYGGPSCHNKSVMFPRVQLSYVFNYKNLLDLDLNDKKAAFHKAWKEYDKIFLNKLYKCILDEIILLREVITKNEGDMFNCHRLLNKLEQIELDFEVYSVWRGLVGLDAVFKTRPVVVPPHIGEPITGKVDLEVIDKRYRNFTNKRVWSSNKNKKIEITYLRATLEEGVVIVKDPKEQKASHKQ